MWMALRRKALHSFLRTEAAASHSRRNRPDFRFYHTHVRAGADLSAGQYSGQVGPVYIEPKHNRATMIVKSFWPQGIRANIQPRRRHGDGFPVAFDGGRDA